MRTSIFIDGDSISGRISIGKSVCVWYFSRGFWYLLSNNDHVNITKAGWRDYHNIMVRSQFHAMNWVKEEEEGGKNPRCSVFKFTFPPNLSNHQPSIRSLFSFLSIQHHVMLHKSNLSTQLSTNQRRGTDIRYVRNEAPHTCDQFTTICYRGEWLITQLGPCSRSAPHVSVAMISNISCNDPPISCCVSGYTSWFHVIMIISRLIVDWWTLSWSELYCMVHICPNYVLMSDVSDK